MFAHKPDILMRKLFVSLDSLQHSRKPKYIEHRAKYLCKQKQFVCMLYMANFVKCLEIVNAILEG